jgi:hypothetical protein
MKPDQTAMAAKIATGLVERGLCISPVFVTASNQDL